MDVDISVAGNLWHIFRPADSPAVVSYRTAHARRFLIGFAPFSLSFTVVGPITRRAALSALAGVGGRGKCVCGSIAPTARKSHLRVLYGL